MPAYQLKAQGTCESIDATDSDIEGAQNGDLEFDTESLRFGDWQVPFADIDEATELTLKGLFSSQKILGIRCRDKVYSFTLAEKPKPSFTWPFPVSIEAHRDHSELIFVGIILLIGAFIWFQFDISL
jgi:hypothetical protein